MTTEAVHDIPGPAGRLEAVLDRPDGEPRAAAVFAHPLPTQGGTMHTRAVYQAAKALARAGCVVLRFNFRGVGGSAGAFDDGRGEMDDFRAALDFMAARYPGLPLVAGGFSFGSWIALATGSADPRVAALLAVAPPVDQYDFSAVAAGGRPTFIVHGEHDELVPLASVRRFYAGLDEPKDLVEIEAADHLFDGKTMQAGEAIEDLVAGWMAEGAR
ncbi:MAG: alpha/beta hydrolase [Vicinamibacterales bacterium]